VPTYWASLLVLAREVAAEAAAIQASQRPRLASLSLDRTWVVALYTGDAVSCAAVD
jgi:hypothetical protein